MGLKKKAKKERGLTPEKPVKQKVNPAQDNVHIQPEPVQAPKGKGQPELESNKVKTPKRKAKAIVEDEASPKKRKQLDSLKGAEEASDVNKKKGAAAMRQSKRAGKKHARFAFAEVLATSGPKPSSEEVQKASSVPQNSVTSEIRKTAGHPLRVFIGGLPKVSGLEASAVRGHFEKCGLIKEFSLPLNSRKIPMGIAFIEFTHRKAVGLALKCHGEEFQGSKISVKMDRGTVQKKKIVRVSNSSKPEGGTTIKKKKRQKEKASKVVDR